MIWNTDRDVSESEKEALVSDFERFNIPLTEKFRGRLEQYVGNEFFNQGKSLGFRFYEPAERCLDSFGFSFAALHEEEIVLISVKAPTIKEKDQGYASTLQLDYVPLKNWVRIILKADSNGEFEKAETISPPTFTNIALNDESDISFHRFVEAAADLVSAINHKVKLNGFLANDRRVRANQSEYRLALHRRLDKYFPDPGIYEEFRKTMSELAGSDFKGLREASCRFRLLEVDREAKNMLRLYPRAYEMKGITPEEVKPDFILEGNEDDLVNFTVNKNGISRHIFESLSQTVSLADRLLKSKNWTLEYGQKFLARVAEQIYRVNISDYPEQIPADLIKYIIERAADAIDHIYSDRSAVAREYVIQKVISPYPVDLLPYIDSDTTQSPDDLKRIEDMGKLPSMELAKRVLGTVRENTEHVRGAVIPHLLSQNADSQSAFWTIHAGEFNQDPLVAQLLSDGSEAALSSYATSMGGDEFYNRNVGRTRQLNVMSGGIAHVDPKYLPELQARLFTKIDSFGSEMTEREFVEFASQVDLIMYCLHLPFDGSGRAIEDFIRFLSEKFKYPLTFTVLGYREAGSPLLAIKEEVGPLVKQEINVLALRNLGIESNRVGYSQALKMIMEKYDCSSSEAWLAYDSEVALITAEIINKLGSGGYNEELCDMIPSYSKLQELWSQARNLSFFQVPEEFKGELDEVTAMISITPDDATRTIEILDRLSLLKGKNVQNLSDIATLLEAFLVSKHKIDTVDRQPQILYNSVFPQVQEVTIPL